MSTVTDRRPWTLGPTGVTVVLAALVIVAAGVALLPVPVALRSLFVLPVLVLVAGHSVTRLVLGGHPADGILRAVAPLLFGVLSLLVSVLLLAALGLSIDTASIALGADAVTLLLLLAARGPTLLPHVEPEQSGYERVAWVGRATLRRAAGVVIAALVLAAAVAGAVALRPVPVESYTQLALTEPTVLAGRPLAARPGGPVTIRWTLRSYGFALTDPRPDEQVTIGGVPVGQLFPAALPPVPDTGNGPRSDAVSRQDGSVGFTAPNNAGLYDVRITVTSADDPTGQPSLLVVTMEVQ